MDKPSFIIPGCLVFGLCFFAAGSLLSCALVPDPRPADRVVIGTWNVENLFDEVDDGDEYPEFDPKQGWTKAQFWARCDSLAQVIRSSIHADILVLQEVEGAHAVEVLTTRFLSDLGYRHVVLPPPTVPGVKTAILSRYPPLRTGLHFPASDDPSSPLRPVVEAEFDLGGRTLVVLANHWKSRIPTPVSTEGLRRDAAQVVSGRVKALEERADRPFVVAVGDFNTSLELSRPWSNRALVSGGGATETTPGLVVFAGRTAAEKTRVSGAVWDPWESVDDPPGSYFYQNSWSRLDHTFVAASSLRLPDWAVSRFQVVAYASRPVAYSLRTPQGVSDHFPLVLTLERRSR